MKLSADDELLVRLYAPNVRRLARLTTRNMPPNVDLDDMVQVGMIGLVDAVGRFDPAQGVTFSTFVDQRIRGAMLDELRRLDWVPRQTRRYTKATALAKSKLQQRLGREPADSEMADELGMTLLRYQRLDQAMELVYIEDLASREGLGFLDRHAQAATDDAAQEQSDALEAAIRGLTERQQKVIRMRYLDGIECSVVAAALGVSSPRISQMAGEILALLRAQLVRTA